MMIAKPPSATNPYHSIDAPEYGAVAFKHVPHVYLVLWVEIIIKILKGIERVIPAASTWSAAQNALAGKIYDL